MSRESAVESGGVISWRHNLTFAQLFDNRVRGIRLSRALDFVANACVVPDDGYVFCFAPLEQQCCLGKCFIVFLNSIICLIVVLVQESI